jgi:hypothetical protein
LDARRISLRIKRFDYIHLFETFKNDFPLPQRQLTDRDPTLKSAAFLRLHCLQLDGSGPPICPPQHALNDRIVVEANLQFRREQETDGIVRCTAN